MTTKSELRKSLKEARLTMSDAEHTLKSRQINKRLLQATDWSRVKSLHYFEPLQELLEVDTTDFVTNLEDQYPDLQLCVPRLIEGEWQLVAARGGLLRDEFDVIIVPMLGFDPKTLQRVGYGGGYYDKFLATQPQAFKIGICFEEGKRLDLATEPHDIPLDLIITDIAIYERK